MTHPYVPRARVYRPSYGNVLPQTPAALQPNYNAEVNRIPINPRRHTAANIIPSQQPQQQGSHLHPLIHRTTRAYDLVINYARNSNGGTRWSYEDIDDIKHVGKYLHRDVLDLKYWKELVTNGGDMDEGTARRIWDDEERLKNYCERVLDVIGDTERLPLRQRMTQDEEMDEGSRESEYGVDDGRNDLGGRTISEESVDDEMYTDLEDKVEEIDQPVDARWATWASESSARFAW
ncbi:hypothetical protein AA0111_g11142 [Alternaria arborescens]|uniref:hypothetical protein n=1 Tax=Alternaria arborescens TaxID=156630 RepID=UPI0010757B03|nr:hypothetical protein AA0111_g11142 [Alternaria arborescens]RYO17144.1 hypothetical protein AA0111_g11142 [Alternaria arborescens]